MNDNPTRREFIASIGMLAGLTALLKTVATPDTYKSAGYIHAKDAVARNIKDVLLNGEPMKNVVEADDHEGWLRRYVTPYQIVDNSYVRMERLEGEVRFIWLTP